jgi:transcriptional regulator with PAS, ATPase and Fis domain
LPALRERKADIPEFVRYFVEQFATSMDKIIETISDETMRSFLSNLRHIADGREFQC